MHKTASSCYCTQVRAYRPFSHVEYNIYIYFQEYTDNRLVQNYIRTKCEDCMDEAQLEQIRRGRRMF